MSTVERPDKTCAPRPLMEILIRQARDLQMLPEIATKAIAVADDPNAKIDEMVTIVAQDVKLTTDLVSLSNSSLFGSTHTALTLQQAITRVGFRQTKNMIIASSINSMLQKISWKEIRIRDHLCKHSFLTGIINSRLNSLFGFGLQGEEFTAGLVHDMGRTLLAVSLPDDFETFDSLDSEESPDILDNEMAAIGTTHADVGAWFLQRNHVPEELVAVAKYHHNPAESTKYKRLVALTAVADELANFALRNEEGALYPCTDSPNLALLETLGVEDATSKLQEFSQVVLESAVMELRQLLKPAQA